MWLSDAQAEALGLAGTSDSGAVDAYAGFSSVYPFAYNPNNRAVAGEYDFIGVVEHELTEDMGRIDLFGESLGDGYSGYSVLDLFHYTSQGVHTYTGTTTDYFSVNGGKTALDYFNSNPDGDLGDWASSAGDDSFLAFSPTDEADVVSQTDITEMNALGFQIAGQNGIVVAASGADAVQGGAAVAITSGAPVISDPAQTNLTSASVQITNGSGSAVAGDKLFVNGQQSGTLDGGLVSVSWNSSTSTLTLTGTVPITEYQTLLSEITYQDTGTDSSTGSHPVRTVTWTVKDGTNTYSTTSNVTIDRVPVASNNTDTVLEGSTVTETATAGVLTNDTDPDGDSLTVIGVSDTAHGAGTIGSALTGLYGNLTLNANGSYSYVASNTAAINAAATGSHPMDVFTYTVSDGNGGTASATLTVDIDRPPVVTTSSINATPQRGNSGIEPVLGE
jgi:VCBS repeat-containing protein